MLRGCADRWPITEGDRREAVDEVMETMRKTKSPRTKIAAVRTLAALDAQNLKELQIALGATEQKPVAAPAAAVQINDLTQLSTDELIRRHRETLALSAGAV
ncbi:MAG: hypothetical protein U0793_20195 [Gemmataceae bacterium]